MCKVTVGSLWVFVFVFKTDEKKLAKKPGLAYQAGSGLVAMLYKCILGYIYVVVLRPFSQP